MKLGSYVLNGFSSGNFAFPSLNNNGPYKWVGQGEVVSSSVDKVLAVSFLDSQNVTNEFIECTRSLISKLIQGADNNDESGESDDINEDGEDNEIGEEGEFQSILICGAVHIKIL